MGANDSSGSESNPEIDNLEEAEKQSFVTYPNITDNKKTAEDLQTKLVNQFQFPKSKRIKRIEKYT